MLLGVALMGAALGAAAAAVLYVNVDRLDIVEKKRAVSKVVTSVDRNAQLTVIAQEGRWYKVDAGGGLQGYVADSAVGPTPVGKKGGRATLSSIQDGPNPQLDTAAAVKGVNPGAQQYASGKGYRTDGLRTLQARREAITPAEFERFLVDGAGGAAANAAPASTNTDSNAAVANAR
jgi:uncharacterized protein YgiM (DUF1202 family)